MILYNTTFGVENSVAERWLTFMKTEFIPLMKNDLNHISLCKIYMENPEGLTSFSLLGSGESHERIAEWKTKEKELLSTLRAEFGERVLWFSTVMEEV